MPSMNRTVVALLIALFAAPALAGCLGGDDVEPKGDESCPDCDSPLKEGYGGVKGKIADETLAPLPGANVTIRVGPGDSRTTKADASGNYEISNIPPGTYQVFAANPPTHKASSQEIVIEENKVTPVDLMLAILPPPPKPHYIKDEFAGIIGCSVAYGAIKARDQCSEDLGDSNAATSFEFAATTGITAVVVYVESSGTAELALSWTNPVTFESLTGPAPLGPKVYEVTEENRWPSWENVDQVLAGDVRASHAAALPQFAFQQAFTVYVAIFYHGMDVPSDVNPKELE